MLSALAPPRSGPKDVMEKGARNIVSAMEKHSVSRLVFATGAGVRAPEDRPGLFGKLMGFLLKTISGDVLEESMRGVEIVKDSDLDWVIARGPMLKDGPRRGAYQVGFVGGNMGRVLTRGNFAAFMLDQVDDDTYLHKMPVASDA